MQSLLTTHLDLALLLVGWAILLWAGTQLPQADVPFAHTDVATRADLLALQGLGLHRIAASLPAWLLTSLTFIVLFLRLDFRRQSVRHEANRPNNQGFSAIRSTSGDFVLGYAIFARVLIAAGTALVLIGWLLHGGTTPAVVLQTNASGNVTAHAPAAGRRGQKVAITGQCLTTGAELTCTLSGGGGGGRPRLMPGEPVRYGDGDLTWVARATPATAQSGRLRWQRQLNAEAPAWYGFALSPKAVVDIPALQSRVALIASVRNSLLVAASTPDRALLAAPPGLVQGPATMRMDPVPRNKLRLGDHVSSWWWIIGASFVVGGLVWLLAWRSGVVEQRHGAGVVVVEHNHDSPRAELTRVPTVPRGAA